MSGTDKPVTFEIHLEIQLLGSPYSEEMIKELLIQHFQKLDDYGTKEYAGCVEVKSIQKKE